jgi:hypothetical protein
MAKKLRYGTDDNKIVLTPKNSRRLYSTKCVKLNGSGSKSALPEYIDFYKISAKKKTYFDEEHTFNFNLISNPYLSGLALRVGMWLYIHILPYDFDALVDLTGKRPRVWSSIGVDGGIDFKSSAKKLAEYVETSEAIPLMLELTKDQICKTKKDLLDALFELHHFQYITATEVSFRNSVEGHKIFGEYDYTKPFDPETNFIFVQLNSRLTTHDYSGKWSPMI